MTPTEWSLVAAVAVPGTLALAAHLVRWGRHSKSVEDLAVRLQRLEDGGSVPALTLRVQALETEMNALHELKVSVAKIETRQETWIEQLKELSASIRWMRDPAAFDSQRKP